jgi:hypoxanthine-DNA glycosylase
MRWSGLAPVMRPDAEWLLLGSFPGVASLKAQQYYGHPRNQFWRLLGDVRGVELAGLPYDARLEALKAQRIALWDVITETERAGSLDSAIRNPAVSDLRRLLRELPALRVIGFNGGTAGRLGHRQLGDLAKVYRVVVLPSSSPAHTMPYDEKLRAWRALNATGDPGPPSQG